LLQLHKDGQFPYDRLIRFFPLEDINAACEAASVGAVIKPVLAM
jgi:aryl-alcohol dehydrogenase